jgi:hypothetical protein
MALKKFEVTAPLDGMGRPTYWDGTKLVPPGTIVELDTDLVKITASTKAVKAVEEPKVEKK